MVGKIFIYESGATMTAYKPDIAETLLRRDYVTTERKEIFGVARTSGGP